MLSWIDRDKRLSFAVLLLVVVFVAQLLASCKSDESLALPHSSVSAVPTVVDEAEVVDQAYERWGALTPIEDFREYFYSLPSVEDAKAVEVLERASSVVEHIDEQLFGYESLILEFLKEEGALLDEAKRKMLLSELESQLYALLLFVIKQRTILARHIVRAETDEQFAAAIERVREGFFESYLAWGIKASGKLKLIALQVEIADLTRLRDELQALATSAEDE